MSITKLKIDLKNNILEVEGEETFVREIYAQYKEKIQKIQFVEPPVRESFSEKVDTSETSTLNLQKIKKSKKQSRVESFSLVSDIKTLDLKEFFGKKSPRTQYEINAVFVYFLQKVNEVSPITLNHIYTCYKLVGIKVPRALRQSLVDTAYHRNFISTKDISNITITVVGENLVEHDLPSVKSDIV